MKVLFIGGSGIISSASSRLAVAKGIDLYHYNRGQSHRKIEGVKTIIGDIRNIKETQEKLKGHTFDAVVNWVNFVPEHIEADLDIFKDLCKQYIFISSASAYQKPIERFPITEETPLINPFWQYSRDKTACEELLLKAHKEYGFPVTIVRPSHTYDNTLIPNPWGYTVFDRMLKGKPVIIPGDGTSLWVMTHNEDFAVGLVGLLGNKKAIGEAFHITTDELLTWNKIYELTANALGTTLNAIHIPSDLIAKFDTKVGDSLLGDKTHSVVFDNSKIKALVPEFNCKTKFKDGIKRIAQWYLQNKEWQIVSTNDNETIEQIIAAYNKCFS